MCLDVFYGAARDAGASARSILLIQLSADFQWHVTASYDDNGNLMEVVENRVNKVPAPYIFSDHALTHHTAFTASKHITYNTKDCVTHTHVCCMYSTLHDKHVQQHVCKALICFRSLCCFDNVVAERLNPSLSIETLVLYRDT